MTLREMHDYLTLIYKAGWDDCLEGRKFDPKIPKYLAKGENENTRDIQAQTATNLYEA